MALVHNALGKFDMSHVKGPGLGPLLRVMVMVQTDLTGKHVYHQVASLYEFRMKSYDFQKKVSMKLTPPLHIIITGV